MKKILSITMLCKPAGEKLHLAFAEIRFYGIKKGDELYVQHPNCLIENLITYNNRGFAPYLPTFH